MTTHAPLLPTQVQSLMHEVDAAVAGHAGGGSGAACAARSLLPTADPLQSRGRRCVGSGAGASTGSGALPWGACGPTNISPVRPPLPGEAGAGAFR